MKWGSIRLATGMSLLYRIIMDAILGEERARERGEREREYLAGFIKRVVVASFLFIFFLIG